MGVIPAEVWTVEKSISISPMQVSSRSGLVCGFSDEGPCWACLVADWVVIESWIGRFCIGPHFFSSLSTFPEIVLKASIVGSLVIVVSWRRDYKRSSLARRSSWNSLWTGYCNYRRPRRSNTGLCLDCQTEETKLCDFFMSGFSFSVSIAGVEGKSGASGKWAAFLSLKRWWNEPVL